jgi:hypothetical protein
MDPHLLLESRITVDLPRPMPPQCAVVLAVVKAEPAAALTRQP